MAWHLKASADLAIELAALQREEPIFVSYRRKRKTKGGGGNVNSSPQNAINDICWLFLSAEVVSKLAKPTTITYFFVMSQIIMTKYSANR